MKVCLDAGHGIKTWGKRTPKFTDGSIIHEAEQNYPVMFKVAEYLKSNGIEVIYTNENINYDMPLSKRAKVANASNADIFISIHANAITGKWQKYAKGIETYVYKKGYNAEKLANYLQAHLLRDTGMYDRRVKEANFYVVRKTKMPATLVELGFMDYLLEAQRMRNASWHDKYAKAIAKGVCQYFKVDFKDIGQDMSELEKANLRIKQLETENATLTKEVFSKDTKIQELENQMDQVKALIERWE